MARRITLLVGLFGVGGLVIAGISMLLLLQRHCTGRGEYVCPSSGACISSKQKCNNVPDCPDGEDEEYWLCGDFHGSTCGKLHKILEKAQNPVLVLNRIRSIPCQLKNIRDPCTCFNGTELTCDPLENGDFPLDVQPPNRVTQLKLIGSNFSLQDDAFLPFTPQFISIEGPIEVLQHQVFRNQIRLKKIDLLDNKLGWLPMGIFDAIPNLEFLNFGYNYLNDSIFPVLKDRLPNLRELNLYHNQIQLEGVDFPSLPLLVELVLDNNVIESIRETTFAELKSLCYLGLNENRISSIHPRAFHAMESLTELHLADNMLESLPEGVFVFRSNFSRLVLNGNPLLTLPAVFGSSPHPLKSLNLEGIRFNNITVDVFRNLVNLEFVYFASFQYCAYVPTAKMCRPYTDGVSALQNLLKEGSVRTCVWTIAVFTSLGNLIVLFGRGFFQEENKVPNVFVRNLAVADLLMGIYLLGIGGVDYAYRGKYQSYSHIWLSSWGCTSLGMIGTIATEVSILLLAFMSMERFLCITCPFGNHKLNFKKAAISLTLIWTLGIALAVIPVFRWPHALRYYGSNGFCLPLHIDAPFDLGWQYSTFIIYGINGSCMLLILFTYGALFASIRSTRCATPIRSTNADWDLALRFFFIVVTNCLCLAPVMAVKTLALLDPTNVSPELSAWVVVFIMPINAALNPFLYTFTTSRFRNLLHSVLSKCLVKQRYPFHTETEATRTSLSVRNSLPSSVTGVMENHRAVLLPNRKWKSFRDTVI